MQQIKIPIFGGFLAVYAPYIDQAEISYRIAKKFNFYGVEIIEILERGLEVKPQGVRPKTRMVGHSWPQCWLGSSGLSVRSA